MASLALNFTNSRRFVPFPCLFLHAVDTLLLFPVTLQQLCNTSLAKLVDITLPYFLCSLLNCRLYFRVDQFAYSISESASRIRRWMFVGKIINTFDHCKSNVAFNSSRSISILLTFCSTIIVLPRQQQTHVNK
jgi:hypothetical protein